MRELSYNELKQKLKKIEKENKALQESEEKYGSLFKNSIEEIGIAKGNCIRYGRIFHLIQLNIY